MSYRCSKCNSIHNGKQNARVSIIRNVNYNIFHMKGYNHGMKKEPKYYKTTEGWETVREEKLCNTCYEQTKDLEPKILNRVKELDTIGARSQQSIENKTNNEEKGDKYGSSDN